MGGTGRDYGTVDCKSGISLAKKKKKKIKIQTDG